MSHIEEPAQRRMFQTIIGWLGAVAALLFLTVAVTGVLMSYKFEANDWLISSAAPAKDFAGIERTIDGIENAGGKAKVNWIWSTAGLRDRFHMNYTTADGSARDMRIAGDGTALLDAPADKMTVLEWAREIHLELASGDTGEWILTIAGLLLLANILYGLHRQWPRGEKWSDVLRPGRNGGGLQDWYRAIGLVGAVPAFIVVLAAIVIHFEHSIEGPIGAPPIKLPAIAPQGTGVGFATMARAAESAVPGSRFVGVTLATDTDATHKAWVNQPGEYFRKDGYGGSLVLVNANDGSVRGAWPLQQASAAYKFMALPYPVHTGEIAGPVGRIFVMLTGLWLATMCVLWLILWCRRKTAR